MTMLDVSLVNPELWDQAEWRGVAYGGWRYPADPIQWMGLLFTNRQAAEEIFRDWRKRLGDVDVSEELRVSIIEDNRPRQAPGYSVHIGTTTAGVIRQAASAGLAVPGGDARWVVSRVHRMKSPSTSRNLERFKAAYARHQQYRLLPMVGTGPDLYAAMDLSIAKHTVHLRHVDDLGPDDVDAVIFGEPEGATMH